MGSTLDSQPDDLGSNPAIASRYSKLPSLAWTSPLQEKSMDLLKTVTMLDIIHQLLSEKATPLNFKTCIFCVRNRNIAGGMGEGETKIPFKIFTSKMALMVKF